MRHSPVTRESVIVISGCLPFLQLNLLKICTSLSGNEFLQVTHSVIWAALDSD